VERLLGRLAFEVRNSLHNTTPDAVHDLRVAIRRFSQGLRIFQDALPKASAKSVRRQIRDIRNEAGTLRDTDVMIELLAAQGLPETHRIFAALRAARQDAALLLNQTLRDLTAKSYSAKWRAALIAYTSPDKPAFEYARERLPELTQDYFKAGRKLVSKARTPAEMHAFRITTKRFRYTLEMFQALYGPTMVKRVGMLQRIQGHLGDLNDCTVALTRYARPRPDDALRDVLAKLTQAARDHEAAFREFWGNTLDAPGEEGRWTSYLTRRVKQQ
jgi:CHAD domain-containing protein